jgi:hypothetical protein
LLEVCIGKLGGIAHGTTSPAVIERPDFCPMGILLNQIGPQDLPT